ncbi:MAG: tRNA (adenosine(37)-N6)-threonylcarbamoyltransferase complex ATPase subunit type 1 TsaE [Steroidobacteraceae bacterium]|jgi:tRNA threonylcarbamoyladenosine biosynthesis protein TsaE|nr:tRNA (adenosine(37)-N6)-threonylcarbamoyltransferase complex ATPase subunit type 1 TsaE [Steroidobacteraceae bacterium]
MREPERVTCDLPDADATAALGGALARALCAEAPGHAFLVLDGDLGAGKTTLARGFLAALGVAGAVRSPTYTLLESYEAAGRPVHHLDWYRLGGWDDLENLGFRDLQTAPNWLLVEWPERVPEVAAAADLAVRLRHAPAGPAAGRCAELVAGTAAGRRLLRRLAADSGLG